MVYPGCSKRTKGGVVKRWEHQNLKSHRYTLLISAELQRPRGVKRIKAYFKSLTNSGAWSLPNRGSFALDTMFVKNHGGQPSKLHRGHAPCSSQLQAKATICDFLRE
jgi:hypothetical protein